MVRRVRVHEHRESKPYRKLFHFLSGHTSIVDIQLFQHNSYRLLDIENATLPWRSEKRSD